MVSLEDGRKNFITIGAINEESLGSVRRPLPEEIPGCFWNI
ncbi:CPCC family cysteine-rich protein [Vibrio ruber]